MQAVAKSRERSDVRWSGAPKSPLFVCLREELGSSGGADATACLELCVERGADHLEGRFS